MEKQLARVGLTERGVFGHYGLEIPFNTVAELGELENTLAITATVARELAGLNSLVTSLLDGQSLRLWWKDLTGIRQGYGKTNVRQASYISAYAEE